MRVAIIGASGFIGLRLTEVLHLGKLAEVRPIVRSTASLAVLARMRLDWQVCDLLGGDGLVSALDGCDACVHAAIGDAAQIVGMASVAYTSCALAKVPRLIWLSSASVHGQNPKQGTDEQVLIHDRHPLSYNNAKVRAEWVLQRLAKDGRVEVIFLRPSIVYGPRSRWIDEAALSILKGQMGWINSGTGICNSIYVDNLVEAIRLALVASGVSGEGFLVGDAETVRWRDLLLPIAEHLGYSEGVFEEIAQTDIVHERQSQLTALTTSPFYGRVAGMVPDRAKRIVKAVFRAAKTPVAQMNPWQRHSRTPVKLSVEMSELQQCNWKLPHAKAESLLGFRPLISFPEGLARSIAWLQFAGYPVNA